MIVRKHTAIFILFLGISFIGVPVCADKLDLSRTYPLPITEMQDVISKWFRDSEFKILRVDQKLSQIRMIAEVREEVWNVCLSQQSPLATRVSFCKYKGGPINPELRDHLWNYISDYVNAPEIQPEKTRQEIPDTILIQRETVVCIEATAGGKTYQATGFIIRDNDHFGIISTAHDLTNIQEINIILYDGSEMPGRILKTDVTRDLILIQIDEKQRDFIPLSNGRTQLEMEEKVYYVTCPMNLKKSVYSGIFSAPNRVDDLILWQVKMEIYPGSSGSPVFDEYGNLAAIVTGRYRGTKSVGFLIPFETLMEFVKEMQSE